MRRLTLLLRFEPHVGPPSGSPPGLDIKSGPGRVTLLEGDRSAVPTDVSYETHVAMTDGTHFVQHGEMALDHGVLRVSTMGSGILEAAAETGTTRGAVIWHVDAAGRWHGADGLVTSNFVWRSDGGTGIEHQVMHLFLP